MTTITPKYIISRYKHTAHRNPEGRSMGGVFFHLNRRRGVLIIFVFKGVGVFIVGVCLSAVDILLGALADLGDRLHQFLPAVAEGVIALVQKLNFGDVGKIFRTVVGVIVLAGVLSHLLELVITEISHTAASFLKIAKRQEKSCRFNGLLFRA